MAEQTMPSEVQLVAFSLGKEDFGIDINQVREILKVPHITDVPNSPAFIEGVINLRGQITTIMDLRKRLNVGGGEINDDARIIIVEVEDMPMGMIVDSVTEVLHLSTNDVDPAPSLATDVESEFISGVGKLQDRLLILLDVGKILSKGEVEQVKKMEAKARR